VSLVHYLFNVDDMITGAMGRHSVIQTILCHFSSSSSPS